MTLALVVQGSLAVRRKHGGRRGQRGSTVLHLRRHLIWLGIAAVVGLAADVGHAADYHWQGAGTDGNTATDPFDPTTLWHGAANWQEGTVPGLDDTVYLSLSGPGAVHTQALRAGTVRVGGSSSEGALYIGEGTGAAFSDLCVGYNGHGRVAQSGLNDYYAANLRLGEGPGSEGYYDLSAGALYSGPLFVLHVSLQPASSGVYAYPIPIGPDHPLVRRVEQVDGVRYYVDDAHGGTKTYDDIEFHMHYEGGAPTRLDVIEAIGANSWSVTERFLFDFVAGGQTVVENWIEHYGETFDLPRLPRREVIVGVDGTGTFTQTGRTHTVATALRVGSESSGNGTYDLSNGALTTPKLAIGEAGVGLFRQSGGSVAVGQVLTVGPNGRYEFTGGDFESDGLHLNGPFDFAGADLDLAWDNLLIRLGAGRFENAGNVALALGPNSLLVHPPGVTPGEDFGVFTSEGLIHATGTTLVVPPGRGFSGCGTIPDRVECAGAIVAGAGNFIDLGGGVAVADGGTVDLGAGTLTVNEGTSSVGAGTLTVGTLTVGEDQPAAFSITDAAAQVTVAGRLCLGAGATFAAVPGATIHMTGAAFENQSTTPANLAGLESAELLFEGGPDVTDTFEVAGENRGAVPGAWADNFALGRLTVGGAAEGHVCLVDSVDNRPGWDGDEALYVHELAIGFGSTLGTNGLALYYDAALANEGTVDMATGNLVAEYPDAGPSPLAQITAMLTSGQNIEAGYWDGPGIHSSAAANDPTGLTTLGVLDNAEYGWPDLEGAPVDESCVLVKYTYYGDADLDGSTTGDDYFLWLAGFDAAREALAHGGEPTLEGWLYGDFDYSGDVTGDDYFLWLVAFDAARSGATPLSGGAAAAIPEPVSLSLVGVGLVAVLARKRARTGCKR